MAKKPLRNWCFTIHLGDRSFESVCDGISLDDVKYVICGDEVGAGGARHVQGYLELAGPRRMGGVKSVLGDRTVHLETRRGTSYEAAAYCRKDGKVWEKGTPSFARQGGRSDLAAVKHDIDRGVPMRQIVDDHFEAWVKYDRAFAKYRALVSPPRETKPIVYVLWGDTGRGKSARVRVWSPGAFWVSDWKWWDGYDGTSDVVLDDFNGQYPLEYLLRLLDRYPLQVQVKGGSVNFNPKRIWITSHYCPVDWGYDVERFAEIARRLDVVRGV